MSAPVTRKRLTPKVIQAMKGECPIVSLTAYTTPVARLLDPHCDLLLVGDSLGMVLYGMESTLAVTLDMMIMHGQAVMRGTSHARGIGDMPFRSYQESKEQAFRNAARVGQETGWDGGERGGGEGKADTGVFYTTE
ncbi:3-methyl-2-oxobutanoate hydroxymethyltransferase, partial [Escherichia coli]|uniref:3-methyl-2-oxobutanoate hydroxymethyltransferase n=1 Tax=Escherichia coli TaxID=562 RepID=UPI0014836946